MNEHSSRPSQCLSLKLYPRIWFSSSSLHGLHTEMRNHNSLRVVQYLRHVSHWESCGSFSILAVEYSLGTFSAAIIYNSIYEQMAVLPYGHSDSYNVEWTEKVHLCSYHNSCRILCCVPCGRSLQSLERNREPKINKDRHHCSSAGAGGRQSYVVTAIGHSRHLDKIYSPIWAAECGAIQAAERETVENKVLISMATSWNNEKQVELGWVEEVMTQHWFI